MRPILRRHLLPRRGIRAPDLVVTHGIPGHAASNSSSNGSEDQEDQEDAAASAAVAAAREVLGLEDTPDNTLDILPEHNININNNNSDDDNPGLVKEKNSSKSEDGQRQHTVIAPACFGRDGPVIRVIARMRPMVPKIDDDDDDTYNHESPLEWKLHVARTTGNSQDQDRDQASSSSTSTLPVILEVSGLVDVVHCPLDAFLGPETTDQDLMKQAKTLIDSVLSPDEHGRAVIIAYGQTASGKTKTVTDLLSNVACAIFGAAGGGEDNDDGGENEGHGNKSIAGSLDISFVQVYGGEYEDLLRLGGGGKGGKGGRGRNSPPYIPLSSDNSISNNGNASPFMCNVEIRRACTADELVQIYTGGCSRRKVRGTTYNKTSSRSHAFLTLAVSRRRTDDGSGGPTPRYGGVITIVDLAGTEKPSRMDDTSFKEGKDINLSLIALRTCLAGMKKAVSSSSSSSSSSSAGNGKRSFAGDRMTELLGFALGAAHTGDKSKSKTKTKEVNNSTNTSSKSSRVVGKSQDGQDIVPSVKQIMVVLTLNPMRRDIHQTLQTLSFGAEVSNNIISLASRNKVLTRHPSNR